MAVCITVHNLVIMFYVGTAVHLDFLFIHALRHAEPAEVGGRAELRQNDYRPEDLDFLP